MLKNSKILERFARNFICHNRIDAINRAKKLKEKGIYSTINNTIEHVDNFTLAGSALYSYRELMYSIEQHDLEDWVSISIKMSALGMDFNEKYCEHNLHHLIRWGKSIGVTLQFDAEGPESFPFYYEMMTKHNFHGCIQAKSWPFLFEGAHRLPSKPPRLVKGAYKTETERKDSELETIILHWIAHYLLFHDGAIIGTHDHKIISQIEPSDKIELQYLHGVQEEKFAEYKELGFKVREYIPYGDNWYPYLMRRIKEDPWGKFKLFLSV